MIWMLWIFAGLCALILCFGAVVYVLMRESMREVSKKSAQKGSELEKRVEELERRLNDVQEIVLSIDEKLERPTPLG